MAIEMLVGLNVVNDHEYQLYRDEIAPILMESGGGFGYDLRILEVLRSKTKAPINRVFTIQFPDEEAMNSFFSDAEYLRIKEKHYEKSVTATTIMARWDQP
jgi:uncharacterized protein (DUF1330 family)